MCPFASSSAKARTAPFCGCLDKVQPISTLAITYLGVVNLRCRRAHGVLGRNYHGVSNLKNSACTGMPLQLGTGKSVVNSRPIPCANLEPTDVGKCYAPVFFR